MQGINKAKPARYTRVPSLRPRLTASRAAVPVITAQPTKRITGRALQGIRRRYLQQHPLCMRCVARGTVSAATQIDHVIPLWEGGADADCNRQGLCDPCHADKTATECARRAATR